MQDVISFEAVGCTMIRILCIMLQCVRSSKTSLIVSETEGLISSTSSTDGSPADVNYPGMYDQGMTTLIIPNKT